MILGQNRFNLNSTVYQYSNPFCAPKGSHGNCSVEFYIITYIDEWIEKYDKKKRKGSTICNYIQAWPYKYDLATKTTRIIALQSVFNQWCTFKLQTNWLSVTQECFG